MSKEEIEKLAQIIVDYEDEPDIVVMKILQEFPLIKKSYKAKSKGKTDKAKQKVDDYLRIGESCGGLIFFGNSMKFPTGSDGLIRANKEWQALYKTDYPHFAPKG